MAKIDALIYYQNCWNDIIWGRTYLYSSSKGVTPSPRAAGQIINVKPDFFLFSDFIFVTQVTYRAAMILRVFKRSKVVNFQSGKFLPLQRQWEMMHVNQTLFQSHAFVTQRSLH